VPAERLYTPDDIIAGKAPEGDVLVYDDDHYYTGAVVAEQLRRDGHAVTLVTPESLVGAWSVFTDEQHGTQRRLIEQGVKISWPVMPWTASTAAPDGGDVASRRERVTV
jgi:dimethylamine/trimethylamine dehydrogenase